MSRYCKSLGQMITFVDQETTGRNMDCNKRTRKKALHHLVQNASSHHSDKEKYREQSKEDLDGKDIQSEEMSEDAQGEHSSKM